MNFSQHSRIDWSLRQKLIFRFIFAYVLLYIILMFMGVFMETPLKWFAEFVLHWGNDLKIGSTGSGDQTYHYVLLGFILCLVLIIVSFWSFIDKNRTNYSKLFNWFLLFIRIVLGLAMFIYGSAKIFKGQFPDPSLLRLLQPVGEMSPMGLAWTFMGHSFMYNIFIGFTELLGGLLMMFKRTVTLGALVIMGVMSNVTVMNFTYDIPVKLFSIHLLLMALILISKDSKRLTRFFLTNERTESIDFYQYFNNPTLRKIGTVLRTIIVFLVLGVTFGQIFIQFEAQDQLKEKSEFYGIWEVEEFVENGIKIPPLATDSNRWEYFIVDLKKQATVKTMTGNHWRYSFTVGSDSSEIKLEDNSGYESYTFNYSFIDSTGLTLNGTSASDSISVYLRRKPISELRLINRGFHWVNETPFNR